MRNRWKVLLWEESTKEDNSSDSDDSSEGSVKLDNRIFFYESVSQKSCMNLNKNLITMTKDIKKFNIDHGVEKNIHIHFNSYWWSLLDAFWSVNAIRTCPIQTISHIDWYAASAATLMSVACNHRSMWSTSMMLIHELSSFMRWKQSKMKEEMENLDMFMWMIRSVYNDNCKIPAKVLDSILLKDTWRDAKTCLKYWLVDEIV